MSAKATLFDRLLADGYYGVKVHKRFLDRDEDFSVERSLKQAVPFVIQDDAVLQAQQLRIELMNNKRIVLPDVARVPFEQTWIEYDPRAKLAAGRVTEDTSHKIGHLIFRDQEIGATVMTWEWHPREELYCSPLVMRWTTDGHYTSPCQHHIGDDFVRDLSAGTSDHMRAMLLTGKDWMPHWKNRIGIDIIQPLRGDVEDMVLDNLFNEVVLTESRSSLSLLMSMLALMAWCPTERVRVKPDGRWLHNRKSKPYMEHTTIRIKIPIRTAYQYIDRGMAHVTQHRRRHRVREHLRVYDRGKPTQKIVLIKEHMRGDASLGFVNQDYEVTT